MKNYIGELEKSELEAIKSFFPEEHKNEAGKELEGILANFAAGVVLSVAAGPERYAVLSKVKATNALLINALKAKPAPKKKHVAEAHKPNPQPHGKKAEKSEKAKPAKEPEVAKTEETEAAK